MMSSLTCTRRDFVRSSAAGCAALAAQVLLAAEPKPMSDASVLPVVDTHQHLWDLKRLRLPWLDSAGPLNRSYLMSDYLEATAGLGVVQAVYMEVDVAADQKLAEAEWIVGICQRKEGPTRAAVIGGLVGTEEFPPYIRRFKGSPFVKGVRHLLFRPETRGGRCLDKTFVEHVRLLGELGMSFDICIAAEELADGVKLVDACPGTRFILDHCGNADVKRFIASATDASARRYKEQWRRDIAAMASRKNVVCKISGIVASAPKDQWRADDLAPIVEHCLATFGPDRVMFGGDWPVCTRAATYRQWVEALRQIVRARSEADNRRLFAENAIRFYGLS
ncbi:MAG: amidohydrolase family protein [Thermoguttaceae bacterium]|jgi:predicted TIM-barrel fold metal-dependent hydrolase|nr:amidohydrolase family protein [Thermoguttaceae bacterium]